MGDAFDDGPFVVAVLHDHVSDRRQSPTIRAQAVGFER